MHVRPAVACETCRPPTWFTATKYLEAHNLLVHVAEEGRGGKKIEEERRVTDTTGYSLLWGK